MFKPFALALLLVMLGAARPAMAGDCAIQPDSTCVPSWQVPVCAVVLAPDSVSLGGSSTATAVCSNAPTLWMWERVGPDGTVTASGAFNTWLIAPGQAGAYQVRVRAQSPGPTGGLGPWSPYTTLTVVTPAVPVCTVATDNNRPRSGDTITLTATCTNSPTSHAWNVSGCDTTAVCTHRYRGLAKDRTYTVVATNAAGPSVPASITVHWRDSGGGGGGGGGGNTAGGGHFWCNPGTTVNFYLSCGPTFNKSRPYYLGSNTSKAWLNAVYCTGTTFCLNTATGDGDPCEAGPSTSSGAGWVAQPAHMTSCYASKSAACPNGYDWKNLGNIGWCACDPPKKAVGGTCM